ALQRGRAGAEIAHALPVASGSRDTRLLEGARGFLTLAGRAQIARFGKDRGQELARAQQVDIPEQGVTVGGAHEQPDDRSRLRAALVCLLLACHGAHYPETSTTRNRTSPARNAA